MTDQPMVTLNDGRQMPQLGQGVFLVPPEDARVLVETGIRAGYQAVDTAAFYRNERGVGEAVRASGKPIFVTTKLWKEDQGGDKPRRGLEQSMKELGLDSIDLYLLHWPMPSLGLYSDTWKKLVELRDEGLVRSVGVSNFTVAHLQHIIVESGVVPAVNQVELHPGYQQRELVEFHEQHGIVTTSWSPLGRGALLDDPLFAELGRKHGKTPAQTILRWHLDRTLTIIPKASSEARLRENLDVFDFALDEEDMARIAELDGTSFIGPHPDSM
ncbi:MAG: aldo/keto reductase [Sphingomicrobium sp.]